MYLYHIFDRLPLFSSPVYVNKFLPPYIEVEIFGGSKQDTFFHSIEAVWLVRVLKS